MKIDIMQVRNLCRTGELRTFVRNDALYIKDTATGEVAMIHHDVKILIQEARTAPIAHGRWNLITDNTHFSVYQCDQCGRVLQVPNGRTAEDVGPYCHCGAQMYGKDD